MTSLSAGRPALQPVPLPGSGRRTLAEVGVRTPQVGQAVREGGAARVGEGPDGLSPTPAPGGAACAPGINTAAGSGAAAGGTGPRRPGLAGFCGRATGSGPGPRLASSPPLRSDHRAGPTLRGRGRGALSAPRALSAPGFSPPDRARSVTRRFHPPVPLLRPVPFPPALPSPYSLSPASGCGAATDSRSSARNARVTQRAAAGRGRGQGPRGGGEALAPGARPRTPRPAAGRQLYPPSPPCPGPAPVAAASDPPRPLASAGCDRGRFEQSRPRASGAAERARTPGANQRRRVRCVL